MRKYIVYGVVLTPLQEMKFNLYLNNGQAKSPNTLSKTERKEMVLEWLKTQIKDEQ